MKVFLEWVFWRQGSGFSMIPSEYSRIPTGTQLLSMSDESFGSMGFTHDEVSSFLSSRLPHSLTSSCLVVLALSSSGT